MMEIVKIFELYDEIPEYINSIDTTGVEILIKNEDGETSAHRIVYEDIKNYLEGDTPTVLGTAVGEYNTIHEIAFRLHDLFIHLDPAGYREVYKNSYLEPAW